MQQSKGIEPRIRVRKEQWEDTIMRKRWISTLAAGAAAVLMLSGFDSAMTVDQLQENAKDALAQVTSLSASMSVVADAGLNMKQNTENGASMDVPINGTGDVTLQLNMEPLQLGMTVNYDWSAMGQGMNGTVDIVSTSVKRRHAKDVRKIIEEIDEKSFITEDDFKPINAGTWRK